MIARKQRGSREQDEHSGGFMGLGARQKKETSGVQGGPLPYISGAQIPMLPIRHTLTERSWPFVISFILNSSFFILLFMPAQSPGLIYSRSDSAIWVSTADIPADGAGSEQSPIAAHVVAQSPASIPEDAQKMSNAHAAPEMLPAPSEIDAPSDLIYWEKSLPAQSVVPPPDAAIQRLRDDEMIRQEQDARMLKEERLAEERARQAEERTRQAKIEREQEQARQARLEQERSAEQARQAAMERERVATEQVRREREVIERQLEQERRLQAEQARQAEERARQARIEREQEQVRQAKLEQERVAAQERRSAMERERNAVEQARRDREARERQQEQERRLKAEQALQAEERARQSRIEHEQAQARFEREAQARLEQEQHRREKAARAAAEVAQQAKRAREQEQVLIAKAALNKAAAEKAQERSAREVNQQVPRTALPLPEQAVGRFRPEIKPAVATIEDAAVKSSLGKAEQQGAQPLPKPKGIPLPLLKGDLKLVTSGSSSPKITATFKEFPQSRRKRPFTRAEARREVKVVPIMASPGERTHEAVIEHAADGIYTFVVEPDKAVPGNILLSLYEGTQRAAAKNVAGKTGARMVIKVLMPEGVLWDEDALFTGSMEDSEGVTKFNTATGLMWREYR